MAADAGVVRKLLDILADGEEEVEGEDSSQVAAAWELLAAASARMSQQGASSEVKPLPQFLHLGQTLAALLNETRAWQWEHPVSYETLQVWVPLGSGLVLVSPFLSLSSHVHSACKQTWLVFPV